MGLHDTEEMLEAARAQSVIDERLITIQQTKLTAIRDLCTAEQARWKGLVGHADPGIPIRAVLAILDRTP